MINIISIGSAKSLETKIAKIVCVNNSNLKLSHALESQLCATAPPTVHKLLTPNSRGAYKLRECPVECLGVLSLGKESKQ